MPTEEPAPVVEPAHAKLNLYLHVVGRRDDGHHLLDSLVAFAELGDEVAASPADALTLAVDGPFADALAGEADNLVLRAARALAAAAGRPAKAALHLTKNLPIASGLGGGSADAAVALRALARLWGVAVPSDLAASLGADVPACLAGAPAFLGGVGERLDPAPALPAAGIVLVNPRVALATPDVFAARSGAFSAPARFREKPGDAAALAALLRERRNDLTPAAVQRVPAIAAVLVALERGPSCLLARMSGSGATCFGLYADPDDAANAATALARERPDWWIAATRFAGG